MKKIISLLSLSALALMGCDAQAQNQGTAVGNPDSNNLLIMEQGYEAVATVPATQPPAQAQPENAPQQPAAAQPSDNMQQPAAVMESITDTQTPDSEELDIEEDVISDND